jgi:hypothetical protein
MRTSIMTIVAVEPKSPEPFCPKCGLPLPEDLQWLVKNQWYCGEVCAKLARTL